MLEGIVPVELCICLSDLIAKRYFTLNYLNDGIASFPFQFSDKTNRPQTIQTNFSKKGTIGGNGHENWMLLRFLPLLIGHNIPEGEQTWSVVLELKDIVELLSSPSFTTETLTYLQAKISDHRQLLLEAFPDAKLRPKHHYLEHYPALIKKFGPLIEFWTMRFEAKHSLKEWFMILATSKIYCSLWPQDINLCCRIVWKCLPFSSQVLRLGECQLCL